GTIGNHENHNASRIYCFTIAHNLGLRVPPVILSNVKNDIIDFLKGTSRVVLKLDYIPLWYSSTENNNIYNTRENELFDSEEVISKVEQVGIFLPSLFIKYINKKYEIRSFYMNGKFKSMAIFSQQNENTKTDFRNY